MVQLMKNSPMRTTATDVSRHKKQQEKATKTTTNALTIPRRRATHPPAIFPIIDTAPKRRMSRRVLLTPVVRASPIKERNITNATMAKTAITTIVVP